MTGLLIFGVLVLLVGGVILLYNGLVRLRVRSDEAWSDIDAQLKRRYDLIPNLVETVKGYASHERGLFEKVAELRSRAMGTPGPREKGAVEGELTQALRTLFAVAENYPQLRASENFLQLQQNLAEVEEQIQLSRRYYNAVVRDLNTRIRVFPSNLIASWFDFKERDFFELEAPEERRPVRVQF
ncbi:MAG: LemA family protein [candidate division NC10 bacterium]|nr:LemA family protein [candidate division NC10 bacterium]